MQLCNPPDEIVYKNHLHLNEAIWSNTSSAGWWRTARFEVHRVGPWTRWQVVSYSCKVGNTLKYAHVRMAPNWVGAPVSIARITWGIHSEHAHALCRPDPIIVGPLNWVFFWACSVLTAFFYASIRSLSLGAPFRYVFSISMVLPLGIMHAKHYPRRKWHEGGRKEHKAEINCRVWDLKKKF